MGIRQNLVGVCVILQRRSEKIAGIYVARRYFSDKNKCSELYGFFEATFATNFRVDNITIIPEFRFENAGAAIYKTSNGDLLNTTGSFLLAAVYKF